MLNFQKSSELSAADALVSNAFSEAQNVVEKAVEYQRQKRQFTILYGSQTGKSKVITCCVK